MMDSISSIRQLMADSKFIEAQREVEKKLFVSNSLINNELIQIYFEIIEKQNKECSLEEVLNLCERNIEVEVDIIQNLLIKIEKRNLQNHYKRYLLLKIKIAEKKGLIQELYKGITDFQIFMYKENISEKNILISNLINRYFKNDFGLKLQALAMDLSVNDLSMAEERIKELILLCFEKTNSKQNKEKLAALREILINKKEKKYLEIYKNFCDIMIEGVQDKSDHKKIVEFIIYFDEFKLQVVIMSLLQKLEFHDLCKEYSLIVRSNKDYSFIYLEKYFSELKEFFSRTKTERESSEENERGMETIKLDVIYFF